MRSPFTKMFPLLALFFGVSVVRCMADVTMPAIFGDHMVLQQSIKLPVWGKADPGEKVTVTVGSHSAKTTADQEGKWSVKLDPLKVNAKPVTMMVTGHNTLKFEDVLVGDVWFASGQSNMEFGLALAQNAAAEIAKADHPLIRLFIVTHRPSFAPEDDVAPAEKATDLVMGHWRVCTPDSVSKEGGWGGFSAVAYFFGREIQEKTEGPVGLIECAVGGMPAQAFTSIDALKQNPDFAGYVYGHDKERDASASLKAAYPAAKAEYDQAKAKWEQDYGAAFKQAMDEWAKQYAQARAANAPVPPRPRPEVAQPAPPGDGSASPRTASNLFNGMVHPVIPFGIKGVIWYQGEGNSSGPWDYGKLFATMIGDWRARWGEGDFPFLYVQLASLMWPQKTVVEHSGFAVVRDMQLHTLRLKNTGMAVAIDLNENGDVHPSDKVDVGHRLALAARHVAYGEKLVCSGPIYDSMKVEGDNVRIAFKDAEGLKIAAHPKISEKQNPTTPAELTEFAIAGSDRQWHPATAKIDGITVVVSSDAVKDPVAVRYGWKDNPDCHLYNGADLPASPFRTDDWKDDMPTVKSASPAASANPAAH